MASKHHCYYACCQVSRALLLWTIQIWITDAVVPTVLYGTLEWHHH